MGQQLTGVHIFEKLGPIEWEDELIAIQAISALSWKKFHGRIELYCNEEHLESLKKWGVDKIYDKIDTKLLSQAPININKEDCWSFCKIYVSSKLEPPFVLVDTDLWITNELEFDTSKSFVSYHEENYDWSQPYNFYVNFNNFVPEKYINYFDLTVNPTNVALLFWNDKNLLKSWYDIVYEILSENRNCELTSTQKTTFLEQWLLPMNAVNQGKDYGVLIPQKYNSYVIGDFFHPELWSPPVSGWNETHYYNFDKIKHVWGLKKMFNDEKIVRDIFNVLLKTTLECNLLGDDLSNVLEFIEGNSSIIKPIKKFNKEPIRVMYIIPDLITNNETNLLIKRTQLLYETDLNVEIFILNLITDKKNNQKLIDRVIDIVGSKNYLVSKKNVDSIESFVTNYKIDICQYDTSYYDEEFNNLMSEIFSNNEIKTIRSNDGVELISNTKDTTKIEYPLLNNIIPLIPEVDYNFSKNELPIHEKIKNRLLHSLDYTHKHILCFVDDIFKIPKDLYKIIDSFRYNHNVQFHFLNFLNHEDDENKKIILRLPNYTKIWLENVDYNDFFILSDLVLDFTTTNGSLALDGLCYGISTLRVNKKITSSNFELTLSKEVDSMISEVKYNLFNKNNSEIIVSGESFTKEYYDFYNTIKNK